MHKLHASYSLILRIFGHIRWIIGKPNNQISIPSLFHLFIQSFLYQINKLRQISILFDIVLKQ